MADEVARHQQFEYKAVSCLNQIKNFWPELWTSDQNFSGVDQNNFF